MSENIGIEAIAPDEKVEIDTDSESKVKKREDENVQSERVRLSKIRKREDPSGTRVRVEYSGRRHLAYISTSPLSSIDNDILVPLGYHRGGRSHRLLDRHRVLYI